ncbi:MAG: phosphatase PAP2 family protein [Pseudomonadota bacterium]|nr:phosphatase PAP2 family protein [Pseudomonadota bacterium]
MQYLALGLPIACFFGLVAIMLTGENVSLFYDLNALSGAHPLLWQNITFMGDTLFAYGVLALFIHKQPRMMATAIVTILLGFVIIHGLKNGFDIRRPAGVLDTDTFTILGQVLRHSAFPSGHSATVFAFAAVISLYYRQHRWLVMVLIVAASLVALSRVIVGAHWPADIFFGAGLGWLCGLLGYNLTKDKQWPSGQLFQRTFAVLSLIAAVALFFHHGGYPEVHRFAQISAVVFALFWLRFTLNVFNRALP